MAVDHGDMIAGFLDAMRSAGVHIDTNGGHPIADGKLHRVKTTNPKRKGKLDAWYVYHSDDPASGAFGDYFAGVSDTWCSKKASELTPEERKAFATRMDEAKAERAADLARVQGEARAASASIWSAGTKASAEHAYLKRKDLPPYPGIRQLSGDVKYMIDGEAKVARSGNLIVPIFTPAGELASVQIIQPDGTKRYLKGTAKTGNYTSVGKGGDTVVVAEGWATAARIHQATGLTVFVAFDSGNLPAVAEAIRKKYPERTIIIAADNDRAKMPDGKIKNPGVEAAIKAAKAVKCRVAVPLFTAAELAKESGRPSDFDDLFQLEGLAAVREAFAAPLLPGSVPEFPVKAEAPASDEPPPHTEEPGGPDDTGEHFGGDEFFGGIEGGSAHPLAMFGSPHFRCLGVDGTTMFYQPADVSQIIQLPASAHSLANLMNLAPLQWWEMEFPGDKGGVNMNSAINACIRACKHKRKFTANNRVRGRGAWFEGDAPVFHAGDHLIVDGHGVPISLHDSKHVYSEGEGIPVDVGDPATTAEARRFLAICKSLRWASPLSAYMLAGFCVIAPVCGFLNWRPHVWVNGPAGSGKSTVMDKIIKAALGSTAISVVGNTTEAGVRNALEFDALPVIFDEVEPKDRDNQNRIRAIMDLARVASSEAEGMILKGTSGHGTKGYRARSMFVFASINTQVEGYADETRFTQLTLQKPDAATKEEEAANKAAYEKLKGEIVDLIDPAFARRLLARTIAHLPRLRDYVRIFTEAATTHLGMQRLGDQIGPMLAGAYLLNTTAPLTLETALEWIRKNDWADHSAKTAARDQDRFLQLMTSHMVRNATPEGGTWERTVGELIELTMGPDEVADDSGAYSRWVPNKAKVAAVQALGRLGIRTRKDESGWFVEVTTTGLEFKRRILHGTEWSGTNVRNLLKNVDGVIPGKGNRYFGAGCNTPFMSIPLNLVLGQREPGEDDE